MLELVMIENAYRVKGDAPLHKPDFLPSLSTKCFTTAPTLLLLVQHDVNGFFGAHHNKVSLCSQNNSKWMLCPRCIWYASGRLVKYLPQTNPHCPRG